MTIKAPLYQLVELIIPASVSTGNQSTYFQQQPQLQSTTGNQTVYIKAIETYSVQALTTSPITASSPVSSEANLANAVLTLNIAGTLEFQMMPLAILNRIIQSPGAACPGVYDLFQLRNCFTEDWTTSYVTTVGIPIGAPFSYLFG